MQPFSQCWFKDIVMQLLYKVVGCYRFDNFFINLWTFKHEDAIGLRAKRTRTTPFWVILREAKEAKLTEACVRVWDDFEWILVKEMFTLVTVLPRGVVLTVLTNTTADPTTGLVHSHVKVASARVAVAVTSWNQNKRGYFAPQFLLLWSCHHCCLLLMWGYSWLMWFQCPSTTIASQALCFTAGGKHQRLRTELVPALGKVPMPVSVPDTQCGTLLHWRKI